MSYMIRDADTGETLTGRLSRHIQAMTLGARVRAYRFSERENLWRLTCREPNGQNIRTIIVTREGDLIP